MEDGEIHDQLPDQGTLASVWLILHLHVHLCLLYYKIHFISHLKIQNNVLATDYSQLKSLKYWYVFEISTCAWKFMMEQFSNFFIASSNWSGEDYRVSWIYGPSPRGSQGCECHSFIVVNILPWVRVVVDSCARHIGFNPIIATVNGILWKFYHLYTTIHHQTNIHVSHFGSIVYSFSSLQTEINFF